MCRRCGLGRVQAATNAVDYWSDGGADALNDGYWAARRTMSPRALSRLTVIHTRQRSLDIGGGAGHFSEVAQTLGWDAHTSDASPAAIEAAAARVGASRSWSDQLPERFLGTFDLVTLWCVIAHVDDPRISHRRGEVRAPRRHTPRHDAKLLIPGAVRSRPEVPWTNVELACPDHILNFTPRSLERLVTDAGLVDLKYVYFGVTEECAIEPRLSRILVPMKRAWNVAGMHAPLLGLPRLSAELQLVARTTQQSPAP